MNERLRPYGVAVALIVGLSPSLVSSAEQLAAEPRLYYVGALLALLAHLVWRTPREEDANLSRAFPWVLAAIAIQILAWAGGFPRLSRFAVPFGIVGFLRGVQSAPLRVALLTFLCIPPPHVVTTLLGIEYATQWSEIARGFAPPYSGPWVPWDGGLRLMAIAAGVVAYRCLGSRTPWGRSLLALGCACVIAVFLQILSFALGGWSPQSIAQAVFVHGSGSLAFLVFLFLPFPGLPRPTWDGPTGAHAH